MAVHWVSARFALTVEAASTFKTSSNSIRLQGNNPEESEIHIRCRENLKSHHFHKLFVS
jgi:hypothetical protein